MHDHAAACGFLNLAHDTAQPGRVLHENLDLRRGIALLEVDLRGFQRQEHKAAVIFIHADIKYRHHAISAHARHRAENRGAPLG